ncbi:hypothetical protein [Paraburkholderia sp. J11-2]|nr:hypothetical protein [Paraburkholderia sp. J11-2]
MTVCLEYRQCRRFAWPYAAVTVCGPREQYLDWRVPGFDILRSTR